MNRDKEQQKWIISFKSSDNEESHESFDKLIVANGTNNMPNLPALTGHDVFKGEILHSKDFKR